MERQKGLEDKDKKWEVGVLNVIKTSHRLVLLSASDKAVWGKKGNSDLIDHCTVSFPIFSPWPCILCLLKNITYSIKYKVVNINYYQISLVK